jgi:hypothetical protein
MKLIEVSGKTETYDVRTGKRSLSVKEKKIVEQDDSYELQPTEKIAVVQK